MQLPDILPSTRRALHYASWKYYPGTGKACSEVLWNRSVLCCEGVARVVIHILGVWGV